MTAATATSTVVPRPNENDVWEANLGLELFGWVTATIAVIILAIAVAPVFTRGVFALSRKMRERRERRGAAEEEENAVELGAWSSTSGVVGEEESGKW